MRASLFRKKLALDMIVWGGAPVVAYLLRFNGSIPPEYLPGLAWFVGIGLVLKAAASWRYRLSRRSWKHTSFDDAASLATAVAWVSVLEVIAAALIMSQTPFPRGVVLMALLLGPVGLFALRALRRTTHTTAQLRGSAPQEPGRRALIVGAGEAGHLVVREMQRHPTAGLRPLAFLDDDPAKQEAIIDGVPVVGRIDGLAAVAHALAVDEVVIAIGSADGALIRRVRALAADADPNLPVRLVPGVYEVLSGEVNVTRLRDVQIEDLLRRPPVEVDLSPVRSYVDGHTVLVTGAGGSIGSELVRQLARCSPRLIVALGHGENSLFELERDLQRIGVQVPVVCVIADVRDRRRLDVTFERYAPQVVFHAAAHKHLPMMETNPEQAVNNNVSGTRNVLEAALAAGVERVVNISTDKAVNPSSVLGASKRLAECVVKDVAGRTPVGSAYVSVRFGNVLGSRGSAVRVFRQQIEAGGPVTITHPDMTRYFMTIPEACQLVLQAAALGRNGTTYLLDMGQPVKILTLAEDLIRLSGLRPHDDIEIVYTGIRNGEKMHEELLTGAEDARPTAHPHVRAAAAPEIAGRALHDLIERLMDAAAEGDRERVRRMLLEERVAVGAGDD